MGVDCTFVSWENIETLIRTEKEIRDKNGRFFT